MAVIPLPGSASATIAPNGAGGETVQFFGLDGVTVPVGPNLTTATFIARDDKIITADSNAEANFANQIFTPNTPAFFTQNLTADTPLTVANKASFATPGLGPVTQNITPAGTTTDQFVEATTPDAFVLTGAGNDTLIAAGGGPNILDGGSGLNMFFSTSTGPGSSATYIADATTAPTSNFISSLNVGDDVIIAGKFASISAGIGVTGLDFQLAGFNGAPSADVQVGNIKAEVNLNLAIGLVTNSPSGQDYFFIHRTS